MTNAVPTPKPASGASTRWHPLALVPLVLTTWVYYPITRVYFFHDDFHPLVRLANDDGLAFVLSPFAGHNLLLRNLAFLGSWHLFGLQSELWYWTVLLTHLLNVWLLFGVLGAVTGSVTLACFGATLWGICPLAAGTIGWYAVYGQVMATTILLVVLDQLTALRAAGTPLPARTAWRWYGLLLAGTTCFGTGIGVALAFPVVLFLLLPTAWRQPGVRLAYVGLPVVTLVTYLGLRRLGGWIEPLTLAENAHLGAAASGLWSAPAMLALLLACGATGSAFSHYFTPQHFPGVQAHATIALLAVGLALLAWRGDREARRAALAMVALALGVYLVIAVGRAHIYTMFKFPLASASVASRYHYLGTLPIVVLLCLALQQIGRIGWLAAAPRTLLLAAGIGVMLAGYARSTFWIDDHAATRAYVTRTIGEIAEAVASAPPGTTVFLENGSTNPVIGPGLDVFIPGRAALFILMSPSDQLDGHPVRFKESDPKVLEYWATRPGTRLGRLLKPADGRATQ